MLLEANDISFSYKNKLILNHVSCSIRSATITILVGPNGSGKTTLLNILSGQISVDSGCVFFNGHDLNAIHPLVLAKNRAVCAQESFVYFNTSVWDYVHLGLFPYKCLSKKSKAKIVEHTLFKVGLAGFEEKKYLQLSGGEKQKTRLARSLVQIHEPEGKLLFLDEPTNHLDKDSCTFPLDLCREIKSKGGSALVCLHNTSLTQKYADTVWHLHEGCLRSVSS